MATAVEDIGILDIEPGVDADAEATDAALRRLTRLLNALSTLSHPWWSITRSTSSTPPAAAALIGPLRHIGRARIEFADRILDVTLGALRKAPEVEAGRCLMDLSNRLEADALDDDVLRSLACLAGMRTVRIPGRSRQGPSRDPGALRVYR